MATAGGGTNLTSAGHKKTNDISFYVAKLSREEIRRNKDLDAARKAGTAPPERDATGKQINPHIPDFMAKAPWYISTGEPGLQHHKADERLLTQFDHSADKLNERYQRGIIKGPAATKFRKGSCNNCGAITHKAVDCLERPRKLGARWTGKDIAPDEYIQRDRVETFDSKRDRWDGYDPSEHRRVVEEYQALDDARQKLREEAVDNATDLKEVEKVAKRGKTKKAKKEDDDEDFGSSESDNEEDESKYADAADVAGQKLDTKNRVTVRNLRIREDTAKYLRNLDVDSAYYDPKSRSMREAPDTSVAPEDAVFAGDNFQRMSGDATGFQAQQVFAWQAESRGQNVHINANPTQAALAHKEFQQRKEVLKGTTANSMLEKYGGAEHLQKIPRELLAGQTEDYVEYSRTGQIIKGLERAKAKSRYDEDHYPGNHSSVWGSYWKDGQWGYKCCHSTIKASYCAGQVGIEAANEEASGRSITGNDRSQSLIELQSNNDLKGKRKAENEGQRGESKRRVGDFGREIELDEEKLRAALKAEDARLQRGDNGKRYNTADDVADVTEEDVEAYRRKRQGFDDPMNAVKGDELLPL